MNFIYITTNLINGKQYVGSHDGEINDNYLGSGRLIIKAIKKYNKEKFKREIIKECDHSINLILEEKYIRKYNTLIPNGYNISPTGGHGLRGKLSKETIEKIRFANKGLKRSNKTQRNISIGKKGKPHPRKGKGFLKEFIEKYGKEQGLEKYNNFIDKQRKAHLGKIGYFKGKTFSKKHRKRLSESHKGIKQSLETIEKRRQKQFGRKHSEETKKKQSEAHKGKKLSKMQIQKMIESKRKIKIKQEIINEIKQFKKDGLLNKEIKEKYPEYSFSTISRIIKGNFDLGFYKI